VILANKGEYQQAAHFMRSYLELTPNAGDAAEVRRQLAGVKKAAASR
jgi:hypothetical protein